MTEWDLIGVVSERKGSMKDWIVCERVFVASGELNGTRRILIHQSIGVVIQSDVAPIDPWC